MMKTRFGKLLENVGVSTVVFSLAPSLIGCGGEVFVGDVIEDAEQSGGATSVGAGGTPSACESCGGAAPTVDCSEEDAREREGRQRWLATDNDFGELAGSRWEGTKGSYPTLFLELDDDQTGSLLIGTPAPTPTRDDGYLYIEADLPEGAEFALHGASFDGEELLVPLAERAPYDAWCALQPPYVFADNPCNALIYHHSSCNGTTCDVDGRTVTQAWAETADISVCTCTTTECFAMVEWPEWEAGKTYEDYQGYWQIPTFRLSYDEEEGTLVGGYFRTGSPYDQYEPVEFVRVE